MLCSSVHGVPLHNDINLSHFIAITLHCTLHRMSLCITPITIIRHLFRSDKISSAQLNSTHITLHYITLHYITLHYITLHYITRCTTLHTYTRFLDIGAHQIRATVSCVNMEPHIVLRAQATHFGKGIRRSRVHCAHCSD